MLTPLFASVIASSMSHSLTLSATSEALQKGMAWYNLSEEEELYQLKGPGHVEFLNQYNTQDIPKIAEGEAALGCFLTQKGKLVVPSLILKQTESLLLSLPQGCGQKLMEHLTPYLTFSDCELEGVSKAYIHGVILGQGASDLQEKIPQAILWKTERFGAPHQELLIPRSEESAWQKYFEAHPWVPMTKTFMESLRIQAGLPKWAVDMDENNLVAEVGLDKRATSFTKGCYLGQETTARVESQGHPNRTLQRFRLSQALEPPLPLELLQAGQKVGRLSSVSASPDEDQTLGLGLLQRKAKDSPDDLYVEVKGEKISLQLI